MFKISNKMIEVEVENKENKPYDAILELMKCPITNEVMKNPVMTYEEIVYEREAIDELFFKGEHFDPKTGKPFLLRNYFHMPLLSNIIKEYMKVVKKPVSEEVASLKKLIETLMNEKEDLLKENRALQEKCKDQEIRLDELRNVAGRVVKDSFYLGTDFSENLNNLKKKIKQLEKEKSELKIELENANSKYFELEQNSDCVGKQSLYESLNLIPDITPTPGRNNEFLPERLIIENNFIEIKSYETKENIERLQNMKLKEYLDKYGKNSLVEEIKIIVKYNKNADIKFESDKKRNAVLYACEKGCSVEVLKYLISLGVDYTKNDKDNKTALYIASRDCSKEAVDLFVNLGQKITHADDEKWTPLHTACRNNSIEVVKTVYEHYKNATNCNKEHLNNLRTDPNCTILHLAACNSNSKEVVEFIADKVDLDLKDKDDYTALHYACKNSSNIETIKVLLAKGANPNIKNNDGLTPFEYGIKYNSNTEVKEFLNSLNK